MVENRENLVYPGEMEVGGEKLLINMLTVSVKRWSKTNIRLVKTLVIHENQQNCWFLVYTAQ